MNPGFGFAFRVHPTTGGFIPRSYLSFEPGPRSYLLVLDVTDNSPLGSLTSRFVFNVSIVNVNDPPLLMSPNVTGIPENSVIGSTQYTFVVFDEDRDGVTMTIVSGNLNTGVTPAVPAFSLGATSGLLLPLSLLNHERLSWYDLEVNLRDNNTQPLTTKVVVRVNVLDRNDAYVPRTCVLQGHVKLSARCGL